MLLNVIAYLCLDALRVFLSVPDEAWGDMRTYLFVIFMGIPVIFLYNFFFLLLSCGWWEIPWFRWYFWPFPPW